MYSQVYGEYRASLAFDLVSSRQKNVSEIISDNNHFSRAAQSLSSLLTENAQKLVWGYSFWIFVSFLRHHILF